MESRDPFTSRETGGADHLLEADDRREPERLAIRLTDEQRSGFGGGVWSGVYPGTDNRVALADLAHRIKGPKRVGQMQQDAGTEHQVVHPDALRREIVDVAEQAVEPRAPGLYGEAERAPVIGLGRIAEAVELTLQDGTDIV